MKLKAWRLKPLTKYIKVSWNLNIKRKRFSHHPIIKCLDQVPMIQVNSNQYTLKG
jgi:hypothetical protein